MVYPTKSGSYGSSIRRALFFDGLNVASLVRVGFLQYPVPVAVVEGGHFLPFEGKYFVEKSKRSFTAFKDSCEKPGTSIILTS